MRDLCTIFEENEEASRFYNPVYIEEDVPPAYIVYEIVEQNNNDSNEEWNLLLVAGRNS